MLFERYYQCAPQMLNMDQLRHQGHWQHLHTTMYRYTGQIGARVHRRVSVYCLLA